MTQNTQKRAAAERAVALIPKGEYVGIGTGSTVNFFIEALAAVKDDIRGAVSTSAHSSMLLKKMGIPVVTLNETGRLPIYFDGADEVNHALHMIKGGGGALLAEKMVAYYANQFVCIADESKYVSRLGTFALPVEVVPFARSMVAKEMVRLGGMPQLRQGFISEGGHEILDVSGLNLDEPQKMEDIINQIPGVMENGIFARQAADILVLGRASGVEVLNVAQAVRS